MNKCDLCINSRAIISENGYHSICCLSEKEARECILNDYSRYADYYIDDKCIMPSVLELCYDLYGKNLFDNFKNNA